MGTGQQFAKKLGVVGCVLVLAASVLFTVLLFTARGGAVEGYRPPESGEYYADHLEELAEELRTGLFPKMGMTDASVTVEDGRLLIEAPKDDLDPLRLSVTYYYGRELFVFKER